MKEVFPQKNAILFLAGQNESLEASIKISLCKLLVVIQNDSEIKMMNGLQIGSQEADGPKGQLLIIHIDFKKSL